MLRWWKSRRLARIALEGQAEEWLARQGCYASPLARKRSIDAYLIGDLPEQERWGRIRELVDEYTDEPAGNENPSVRHEGSG
jgi:hypothetical protein